MNKPEKPIAGGVNEREAGVFGREEEVTGTGVGGLLGGVCFDYLLAGTW